MKKNTGNWHDVYLSIVNTGGASYNTEDHTLNPEEGYMVAIDKKYGEVYSAPKDERDFMDIVKHYVVEGKAPHPLIHKKHNLYFGFWLHKGKLHVDVSEIIMDRHSAIKLGRQREQLAIYDNLNKADIDTRIIAQL